MYHWSFTGVNCRKLALMMPEVYDSTNSTPQNKTVSELEYKREIIKQVKTNMAINEGKNKSVRSVAQSHPTLCNPMNYSTWGLPVHHQLLESTKTHVHSLGDAIQPSHPLSSPSPALNLSGSFPISQFISGGPSIRVSASASVLPMNIQKWFPLGLW